MNPNEQDRNIPWYITASIVCVILAFYYLAQGELYASLVKNPIAYTVFWYSLYSTLILIIVAILMLPFWFIIRNHVRPAKVSFGLFLIYGLILFVGFDLFDRNVMKSPQVVPALNQR